MFTYNPKGHKYELDGKLMTGVTTVLGVIAKPALVGWAAKMTAEWIRENCATAEEILNEKLPGHPWLVYDEQLQEAVKAHTKKKEAGGQKGTDLHSEVEHYVNECIVHKTLVVLGNYGFSTGLREFVKWATANKIRFLASEKQVYSKEWFVAGTFDFSFEKDGKRFIGDLKTMKKVWDRTPFFQTAAYMKMSEEMGEPKYDGSCIVNINKETNELTDHWTYDHENDKRAFEAALLLYRQLNNF